MTIETRRGMVLPALIVGGCILVGLALGGYFIGQGAARFKVDSRTVIVKGLVEREVKADHAVWTLRFRRAGEDLKDAHARITADREAAIVFLKAQGFKDQEVRKQPVRTIDKLAREYDQNPAAERMRYVVTGSLVVTTNDVDRVTRALGATEELLKSGVIMDGQEEGGMANPRYAVTTFNALRPQLLSEATRNAKATAQQFAAASGAQVGRIRSANQGSIQIFGTDGNDESAPYSPTSTPVKKIRVVSTFEFELR